MPRANEIEMTSMRRIAKGQAVERMTTGAAVDARARINDFITQLVYNAQAISHAEGRVVVRTDDVEAALAQMHYT